MSDSFKNIPDPLLPEHRLLRNAGDLPTLSSGLRNRVVLDIHKQARFGRWMDRVRVLASVAAALLFIVGMWSLRQSRPEHMLESQVQPSSTKAATTSEDTNGSIAPSGSSIQIDNPMHAANPDLPIELRDPVRKGGGGGGSNPERQNLNESQQINRLIEHYQQRQTALCGLLPLH